MADGEVDIYSIKIYIKVMFTIFSQVGDHYLHNVLQQVVQRKSLHLPLKKNQKYSMPGKRDIYGEIS